MRILLIEDAEDLGEAIEARLRAGGHIVEWLQDGADGAERLQHEEFDVVVLDIMLPGRDGMSILAGMRRAGHATPVLVITARAQVDDRVTLLDLGADDYLVKPFDLRELEARLRSITRRHADRRSNTLSIADLEIDFGARSLSVAGRPVECGRREFSALEALLTRLGQVVPRERLMGQVFSADDEVTPNALELVISRLRRKLRDAGIEIVASRNSGYVARARDGEA